MKKLTLATLLVLTNSAAWAVDFKRFYKDTDETQSSFNATTAIDYKALVQTGKALAERGSPAAQFNLGLLYDEGDGITEENEKAAALYKLSAEQGFVNAQFKLGVMYGQGEGVIQDYVYAHMWSNIAAASGMELAKRLRDTLEKGMTRQDISKAQELARECVKKDYNDC